MQTNLRSDAFLCDAMERCGDAVYRLALCRLDSRADAEGRISGGVPATAA